MPLRLLKKFSSDPSACQAGRDRRGGACASLMPNAPDYSDDDELRTFNLPLNADCEFT